MSPIYGASAFRSINRFPQWAGPLRAVAPRLRLPSVRLVCAMSDNFEMLVDVDATPSQANAVARAVLDRFRHLGLITGKANPDCVLGNTGYRPGPAVASMYKLSKGESRFWELVTCGVEPRVGRAFNEWALGPSCEGFTCPMCGAEIEPDGAAFGDAIGTAVGEWIDESGPALVSCPQCRNKRPIAEWQCKPPFGFGFVSFRFWNWPPLDSPSWKIDIAGIVREVSGHTVVRTYGHI